MSASACRTTPLSEPHRSRSTPRPSLDPCRGASTEAGARRPPTFPVRCPATDAAASAHESSPDRTWARLRQHTSPRCISLHDMGPARKRSRHDVRPRTTHRSAHRISRHTRPARWLRGWPVLARPCLDCPEWHASGCDYLGVAFRAPSAPRRPLHAAATSTRDAE